MTQAIIRPAKPKDSSSLIRLLKPWLENESFSESDIVSRLADPCGSVRCTVVEAEDSVIGACIWTEDPPGEVRIIGFGISSHSGKDGIGTRILSELIVEWSRIGIARAWIELPESLGLTLSPALQDCGFVFEGLCSCMTQRRVTATRLVKHFVYRTVPHDSVMGFLKDFMVSMNYEVEDEPDGFRYRVSNRLQFPFVSSPWHRITMNGPDIIVQPPARSLHWQEIETLFYPLRIQGPRERALVVSMNKSHAESVIQLPDMEPRQKSLFNEADAQAVRPMHLTDWAYSLPVGIRNVRRGLPVIFYVNRVGAVGTGRVVDWYLDEPDKLLNIASAARSIDPDELRENVAKRGPKSGKVLLIRFQWYRPLGRPVSLKAIRRFDATFSPQRTKTLSPKVLDSIIDFGNGREKIA
jgi:hypothetical protein